MMIDDSSCKIGIRQQQSTESDTSENISKALKGQSVLAGEPMPKSLSRPRWTHGMSDSQQIGKGQN